MAGLYERRRSRAALWCQRLAIVSLPFLLLTVLLHRYERVTTQQSFWLFAFAIAMLTLSLLLGLRAAADLWEKGYKGGRATVNGIALSLLLLTPFGIQFLNAVENPALNDVATDVVRPPQWLGTTTMAPEYEDWQARTIVNDYPNLIARRYNAPPERVLASVSGILERWAWQVNASANLPDAGETADGGEEAPEGEVLAGGPVESPEEASNEDGRLPDMLLQAEARTFIMRLPSRIIVRLTDAGDSTLVDMRSASDWAGHDFGVNARHIRQFLEALDADLAGVAGEV